jgi:hypothetical protein
MRLIMARAVIAANPDAPHHSIGRQVAADLMWGAAGPDVRLEHIYVRSRPGHLDIVFFLMSRSRREASAHARSICERAVVQSSLLRSWNPLP